MALCLSALSAHIEPDVHKANAYMTTYVHLLYIFLLHMLISFIYFYSLPFY